MPHLVIALDGRVPVVCGEPAFRTGVPGGAGAWWNWDGGTLTAGSEPFGFYPLYLLQQGSRIGIATSIIELLPYLQQCIPDREAMAVFLRLGYYLGQDTPWRAIRAFPAATRIRWRAGEAPQAEDAHVPLAATTLDRSGIVRRYLELFEASIAASAPRFPVVLPLTGGRDSRHILFELMRQGRAPALAITAPRGDDIRIARRLATHAGLPHEVVHRRGTMHDELRKNLLTSFCSDEHGWVLPTVDALAEVPRSIYDGIAGGMLSAGAFLTARDLAAFEAGRFGELAARLLHSRDVKLDRIGPLRRQFPLEPAIGRVESELRQWAGRVNGLTEFYLWNRTRREIALYTFEMLGIRHEVHAPYLSRELIGFLLSVPPGELSSGTLHTQAIAAGYPQHAGIPYEQRHGLRRLWRRVRAIRPAMVLQGRAALAPLGGEVLGEAQIRRLALQAALEERITVTVGAPVCLAQALHWSGGIHAGQPSAQTRRPARPASARRSSKKVTSWKVTPNASR